MRHDWLVIGHAHDPRVAGFRSALGLADRPAPRVRAYRDILADTRDRYPWHAGTWLRLESPAACLATVRDFMRRGEEDAARAGFATCPPEQIQAAELEQGEFIAPHQFHFGYRRYLADLDAALARQPVAAGMQHLPDIPLLYDKSACHQTLHQAGIPVPRALTDVGGYAELRERMRAERLHRVFIKSRFGSGGSGIVALASHPDGRMEAWTTLESDGPRWYNSLKVLHLRRESDIAPRVDGLCRWGAHVEQWVPKAAVDGMSADLRLLMVAGQPAFTVLRKSRSPITNLHLLNQRAPSRELTDQMPAEAWEAVLNTGRRVAARFPRMFHLGVDVAVDATRRRHVVLEVNVFGDFLRGVERLGLTPQAWQIQEFPAWARALKP